ncbi:uncharacterized protein PV06_05780 [Exophiala oligosperma]|uniref:DUF3752 domain-containing protein n=1 Tax=Exophiala oligosperma TaxID=215243 RepID=A0A0D2DIE2_9EURO|nr:uncharacterized protein PV06_05780 [Exophiala oligosperma]KIW42215.1 hypothetical protein PV06_05780 [Exophiala oligosperma]
MAPVGPQLPPELQKRKRSPDDENEGQGSSSDSSTGPLPQRPASKESSPPSSKRSRVIGPTLPPAPLDERPPSPPQPVDAHEGESSDDDDFGPSLPSAGDSSKPVQSIGPQISSSNDPPARLQRDEWMTMAPDNGDWSSRIDPTKLKNRKFNTTKGAKGPQQSGVGGSSWHETPEEKQARLRREVMGISDPTASSERKMKPTGTSHDEATAKRVKEYSDKQRGPSLYASHSSANKAVEEDDPSARAFDREKDIGGGMAISATKRREMVKKAADFSSRFSEARYL